MPLELLIDLLSGHIIIERLFRDEYKALSNFDDTDFYKNWGAKIQVLLQLCLRFLIILD